MRIQNIHDILHIFRFKSNKSDRPTCRIPPPHINRVAIAVAFFYVLRCFVLYINYILPKQYKLTL